MGILTGDGSNILNSVFAAIYPSGTLVRRTITEDAGGSQTVTTETVPIKVQTDRVTEAMRQAAGYTDKDVRLIVLSAGVSDITSDDIVIDGGGDAWSLIDPAVDPCGSHWEMRGQRASYVLPDPGYLFSPVDADQLLSPVTAEPLIAPENNFLSSVIDGEILTGPTTGGF